MTYEIEPLKKLDTLIRLRKDKAYGAMHNYFDNENCIGCGACVAITDSKVFDFNDNGLAHCIVDTINEEDQEYCFYTHYRAGVTVCRMRLGGSSVFRGTACRNAARRGNSLRGNAIVSGGG